MKQILVVNRINTDNYGDRLIARSMRELFHTSNSCIIHADFAFFPYVAKHKLTKAVFPVARILYRLNCYTMIRNSDCVIIGGGELISGETLFFDSLQRWIQMIKKVNSKAKIFLYSVGVTENLSEKQIEILNYLSKDITSIWVRDNKSLLYLKNVLMYDKINYVPDSVFSLSVSSCSKDGISVGITSLRRHAKHHFLSFKNEEEMFEYYYNRLINVYNRLKSTVRLIYNTIEDKIVARRFGVFLEQKGFSDYKECVLHGEEDLMNVIASSEYIISPRMHACILGVVSGCEVEPIIISNKMHSFSEMYNNNRMDIESIKLSIQIEKKRLFDML